jgi:hypothetical protein
MTKTILVVGASGKQGTSFISAINSIQSQAESYSGGGGQAFHLLALTRNEKSIATGNDSNVTVVKGDLDSPSTIKHIFEDAKSKGSPIWGVFCVLAFGGLAGTCENEVRQFKVRSQLWHLSISYSYNSFSS